MENEQRDRAAGKTSTDVPRLTLTLSPEYEGEGTGFRVSAAARRAFGNVVVVNVEHARARYDARRCFAACSRSCRSCRCCCAWRFVCCGQRATRKTKSG